VAEKNDQVKLMAAIYSSAVQVLAFLGPHSEEVDAATDRVLDYLQDTKDSLTTAMSLAMENDMKMFLEQPYFDRVWVLQEVGLAKLAYLVTMKKMICWDNDSIQKVLQLCSGINALPPSILSWAPAQPASGQSLLEALHRSRNCSATDMRDKVFGVLGLAYQGKIPESFPLDYSLSATEVFAKTALFLVETGDFNVFKHTVPTVPTGARRLHVHSTPSWIPQWSVKDVYQPVATSLTPSQKAAVFSSWHLPLDARTMCTEWMNAESSMPILEEIETLCRDNSVVFSTAEWEVRLQKRSTVKDGLDWSSSIKDFQALSHCVSRKVNGKFQFAVSERKSATAPSYSIPYLQIRAHRIDEVTMVDDTFVELTAGWEYESPSLNAAALDPLTECSIHDKQDRSDPLLRSEIFKRVERCRRFAQGMMEREIQKRRISSNDALPRTDLLKRVFITNQSIGLARGDVIAGDTVWVLENTDMPFLLRREGDHYVLVGECYLRRAGEERRCLSCGEMIPWHTVTEIIDLW
jgi:hypothetical protein